MKIVIAPDSFKECLPAAAVAEAIAKGLLAAWAAVGAAGESLEIVPVPMADGGEGTVQTVLAAAGGQLRTTTVTGPLNTPVQASYALLADGKTAVLEMAGAAGLHLVPLDQRDPTRTTTYGVGELIRAALDGGATRLLIGIGGSSTTDGGAGCAQALGWRFLDQAGCEIQQPMTGGRLKSVHRIDGAHRDVRLDTAELLVACDVDNPLAGPCGAAAVYGPQKGATPAQVALLDEALVHMGQIVHRDTGRDVALLPGAGAAGGLGAGLVAFGGAALHRGVESVARIVNLSGKLAGADLVITGEGRFDEQSLRGKVISGVAGYAAAMDVPVVVLAGQIGAGAQGHAVSLAGWLCIIDRPMSLQQALAEAPRLLENAAQQVLRLYVLGRK